MPNIMLTYRCNLKCPYCFANEFVNTSSTDISMEAFREVVVFLTKDGPSHIGLIGGEPTLHPEFAAILEEIIRNPMLTEATIYTNGILLDRYTKLLVHPKFRLLINCNSPEQIGEARFQSIQNNVDELILGYHMKERINLGINLYDDNMDYSYIIKLLNRYDLHRVRISLTVPDFSDGSCTQSLPYFKQHKAFLLRFIQDLDKANILPYYDCNKPPYCIWDADERSSLEQIVKKYHVSESNLIGNKSYCYPVIDILPDLTAVRCFGMSSFNKVKIQDFESVPDLASYFLNTVDACAYKLAADEMCKTCYQMKTRHCAAGCMGFKQKRIESLNQAAEQGI